MARRFSGFRLSRSLKDLIRDIFGERQLRLVREKLSVRMSQYIAARKNGKESAATSFQQLVDFEIEFQKQSNPDLGVSVRKGRCSQAVLVTEDEARLIEKHIADHSVSMDSDKLHEQSQWSSQDWESQPKEKRQCLFSDGCGGCRIEDFMPMSCRKQIAFADSDELFVVPDAEVTASAAYNCCHTGYLPNVIQSIREDSIDSLDDEEPQIEL